MAAMANEFDGPQLVRADGLSWSSLTLA